MIINNISQLDIKAKGANIAPLALNAYTTIVTHDKCILYTRRYTTTQIFANISKHNNMGANTSHTIVNPQSGNLAFRVFGFDDNSHFNHIQRLSYYSVILILNGAGHLKADFYRSKT